MVINLSSRANTRERDDVAIGQLCRREERSDVAIRLFCRREERSDVAISKIRIFLGDCRVASLLAMTGEGIL